MVPSSELILKLFKTKSDSVCIDNVVFKLHYKFTAVILVTFASFLSLNQFVGKPMRCFVETEKHQSVVDEYCWVHRTFIVPNKDPRARDTEIAPGVGPLLGSGDSELQYQFYYQWVFFVLFIQAASFYLPRYMWKTFEGNLMKSICMELRSPIVEQELMEKRLVQLQACFLKRHHRMYVAKFVICEVLNLANVAFQIWFVDYFMDNQLRKYTWLEIFHFINTNGSDRNDSLVSLFPKLTKCTYHKYGPSGTKENLDVICVLPLNVINEKIILFSWLWFSLLLVLTVLCLLYRGLTFNSRWIRYCVLRSKSPTTGQAVVKQLSRRLDFSDWFMLCAVGKNVYRNWFDEFMTLLGKQIDRQKYRMKQSSDSEIPV